MAGGVDVVEAFAGDGQAGLRSTSQMLKRTLHRQRYGQRACVYLSVQPHGMLKRGLHRQR